MNVNFISEEKELLLKANANGGVINILSTSQTGEWIHIGDVDFKDNSDPSVAAKYRAAYRNLCEQEHIEEKGERYAILTASGWEIARELAEEELKNTPPQDEESIEKGVNRMDIQWEIILVM